MEYIIKEEILKAGKKDISHLVKKVITDKRGKRTTVWVLPGEALPETKQDMSLGMAGKLRRDEVLRQYETRVGPKPEDFAAKYGFKAEVGDGWEGGEWVGPDTIRVGTDRTPVNINVGDWTGKNSPDFVSEHKYPKNITVAAHETAHGLFSRNAEKGQAALKELQAAGVPQDVAFESLVDLGGLYLLEPQAIKNTKIKGIIEKWLNVDKKALKAELVAAGVNWKFRKELLKTGRVTILGQKIDGPSDLASLSNIYRNPMYETFRIVMIDSNNIVKGITGVSCRLPGMSVGWPELVQSAEDLERVTRSLKAKMARVGASKYYLVHNHPSGSPIPSSDDKALTANYSKVVPGLVGHVITDHKTYGFIEVAKYEGAGKTQSYSTIEQNVFPLPKPPEGEDPLRKPAKPHGALGYRIRGPLNVAELVNEFKLQKDGYLTLVGVTAGGIVGGIMEVPHDYFAGGSTKGIDTIKKFGVMCGTSSIVAVGIKEEQTGTFARVMQDGYLRDTILIDKEYGYKSLNEQGIRSKAQLEPPNLGKFIKVREEQ
jgi:hypothetical protein